MTLGEVIDLKPKDAFVFRGVPAICIWTYYHHELVASGMSILNNKMSENWSDQFGMLFETAIGERITIRSSWRSRDLVMPDFELP